MKLSSHDVTWHNVLVLHEQKERSRGRWMGAPEGMAVSGFSFGNTLVGTGWGRFCPPMHKPAEKIVLSPTPIPGSEAFFSVWASS